MADELLLLQVPEAKPDDNEDVSWALSTAEAMWARGDHADGIKWLRKAAEAASDAEQDMRALELAKAASDLSAVLTRGAPTAPSSPAPATPKGASAHPSAPATVPPKRSPPPLAPRTSQAPAPPASSTPSKPPRPLAAPARAQGGPAPGRGVLASSRVDPKKGRRRSRESLEDEARAAGVADLAPTRVDHRALADRETSRELSTAATTEVPSVPALPEDAAASSRGRRRSRPGQGDRPAPESSRGSAAEWDRSPTQSLTGEEIEQLSTGDRMTALGVAPAPPAPSRPPKMVHDEQIETSQAVRVVVWRDGDGVHVAPAGTVVSAITVDAVLVALKPGADLTAWLSRRDR